MPEEGHFGKGKHWGEKCHGLEIFNDFTYVLYKRLHRNTIRLGGLIISKQKIGTNSILILFSFSVEEWLPVLVGTIKKGRVIRVVYKPTHMLLDFNCL